MTYTTRTLSLPYPADAMSDEASSSPTPTGSASSSSRTGPGCRAGATSPPRSGPTSSGSAPTASRTSSSCTTSWATCSPRTLLRRPRARPGRARDDVDAPPAADAQHDGAVTDGASRRRRRVHRGVLRRPGPPLHAPGLLRPPHRLAVPPARDARQPARARHVGGRGADPPLPHQGARRAAADLPAVLRPLHPDGPRRQLHAAGRQAEAGRQAGRPVCRDARLPAPHARASATSSSPAATWPTCRGRTSRRSSTGCSRSTTSATSGWPPRR